MNIFRQSLVLCITGALLSGCQGEQARQTVSAEQQAVAQMVTPFAQGAITLNITAGPDLNSWNEIANSCTVLVIQAQKASALNRILSNPVQLKSLFSGAGAEDDILKVDRYPAMPGQRTTLHIDRSESTREVAIVAGYYPFPKKQHMAIVSIPVTLNSTGWWSKIWTASLSPLTLNVTLGSHGITQLTKNSPPEGVMQPANTLRVQSSSETVNTEGEE